MSSSPSAKAVEKTRIAREIILAHFVGQLFGKKNGLKIDLKLSGQMLYPNSRMVFGLEKRITKSPISQTKADLWGILKAVAPPDCPSMQGDVKSFCKQLEDNKNLKQKKYSKNAKDWYTKSFFFHNHQKKRSSLVVSLPQENKQISVLQIQQKQLLGRNVVLVMFIYERVFAHSVKTSKKFHQVFTCI